MTDITEHTSHAFLWTSVSYHGATVVTTSIMWVSLLPWAMSSMMGLECERGCKLRNYSMCLWCILLTITIHYLAYISISSEWASVDFGHNRRMVCQLPGRLWQIPPCSPGHNHTARAVCPGIANVLLHQTALGSASSDTRWTAAAGGLHKVSRPKQNQPIVLRKDIHVALCYY